MTIKKVSSDILSQQHFFSDRLSEYYANESLKKGHIFTYKIHTYGCQLNEADSEKIEGVLESVGMKTAGVGEPDIVIFNTCAIRAHAEDKLFGNLGAIKSAKMTNRRMLVAVCGCMMKMDNSVTKIQKSFPFVDMIFGPQDIQFLPELLYKSVLSEKKVCRISDDDYLLEDLDYEIARKRKFRALVPIMYGCNNFCTYCVVPYTRGRERSRDFSSIMEQLHDLAEKGYKEILLLGQNVNSYGNDFEDMHDFPDLLLSAAKMNAFSRIRFMTSHPKDLSDRVIHIMAENNSIERHLHLPVQSGSNRILKKMNRKYTREQYLRTAALFRKMLPDATISTDIIVGFPGETEEDFLDTLRLMETVRFDSAYTFQYSSRPGTKAADYPDLIPQEIVTERFSRLVELQNCHSLSSNASAIGTIQEVLIEGASHTAENILTGRTSSNRLVNFVIPPNTVFNNKTIDVMAKEYNGSVFEGELAMVKITNAKTYSVEGELEYFLK